MQPFSCLHMLQDWKQLAIQIVKIASTYRIKASFEGLAPSLGFAVESTVECCIQKLVSALGEVEF